MEDPATPSCSWEEHVSAREISTVFARRRVAGHIDGRGGNLVHAIHDCPLGLPLLRQRPDGPRMA